jgi:hypothetical protein
MPAMLTIPALTLLLASPFRGRLCLMFWEIEREVAPQRRSLQAATGCSSERLAPSGGGVPMPKGKKTRPSAQYAANDLASPGY